MLSGTRTETAEPVLRSEGEPGPRTSGHPAEGRGGGRLGDFTRTWPALAAWGAGLLHLFVAAGSPGWPIALLCAATEIGWGTAVLRAGRTVMPRAALYGALALVLVSTALTLAGGMGIVPLAAAGALLLFIAASVGAGLRRGGASRAFAADGRAAVGLLVGAALVACITMPALAPTDGASSVLPPGLLPSIHGH